MSFGLGNYGQALDLVFKPALTVKKHVMGLKQSPHAIVNMYRCARGCRGNENLNHLS